MSRPASRAQGAPNKQRVEGAQFVRFFGPLLDALRELGGSGTPREVLFQCKRYSKAVTPSQVRDFRGAMQGRADKGIILTTGTFTGEARREASRDGVPPIELVDGEKLLEMFEELELGLKPVKTFEIDDGFFDEFARTGNA